MTEQRDAGFDSFADNYDAALARGLSATGEDKDYFARQRLLWLAGCLKKLGRKANRVLDFGCGTGSATPHVFEALGADSVVGVDVSEKSLEIAARQYGSARARFCLLDDYPPNGQADVAFCNGVFHHVPLDDRLNKARYVHGALQAGGIFAFWENSPWNPGTRYVMWKIPFDRDAIMLSPPQARRLLRSAGFEVIFTDFLFIFPKALGFLRWMEPMASKLPLGGQYQVLCRKS